MPFLVNIALLLLLFCIQQQLFMYNSRLFLKQILLADYRIVKAS